MTKQFCVFLQTAQIQKTVLCFSSDSIDTKENSAVFFFRQHRYRKTDLCFSSDSIDTKKTVMCFSSDSIDTKKQLCVFLQTAQKKNSSVIFLCCSVFFLRQYRYKSLFLGILRAFEQFGSDVNIATFGRMGRQVGGREDCSQVSYITHFVFKRNNIENCRKFSIQYETRQNWSS